MRDADPFLFAFALSVIGNSKEALLVTTAIVSTTAFCKSCIHRVGKTRQQDAEKNRINTFSRAKV